MVLNKRVVIGEGKCGSVGLPLWSRLRHHEVEICGFDSNISTAIECIVINLLDAFMPPLPPDEL